jgi:serine/threonine-protein kinase
MSPKAVSEVIGRYTIHSRIASGGMASVYLGRLVGEAGFSRTVAIKRLHAHLAEEREFRLGMIDEARLAARIHHPNVVPTLDVVSLDEELLVVMEYVRGESLGRLLNAEFKQQTSAPAAIVSAVGVGALHGLHAAHEATHDRGTPLGLVHRDISPQNILVGIDGVPRVIDFGIAKAAGRLQSTETGRVKGKLAYMPPEQISGRPLTRAADIYSMGVVLWEAFANRRLFHAETQEGVIAQVLAGAHDPPSRFAPSLPNALDVLIMRALARRPESRFATALEMAEALFEAVPPASATEVGRWCMRLARESLGVRESMLADIESSSAPASLPAGASDPSLQAALIPLNEDARPVTHPMGQRAFPPTPERGASDAVAIRTSTRSMAQPRPVAAGAPRSRLPLRLAAAVAALVVVPWVTLVYFYARPRLALRENGAAVASSVTPALTTPAPTASVEAPANTASGMALPAVPPSPAPSIETADSTEPADPRRAHRTATPRAPDSSSCTPNFYYDKDGYRHFKPACFVK